MIWVKLVSKYILNNYSVISYTIWETKIFYCIKFKFFNHRYPRQLKNMQVKNSRPFSQKLAYSWFNPQFWVLKCLVTFWRISKGKRFPRFSLKLWKDTKIYVRPHYLKKHWVRWQKPGIHDVRQFANWLYKVGQVWSPVVKDKAVFSHPPNSTVFYRVKTVEDGWSSGS